MKPSRVLPAGMESRQFIWLTKSVFKSKEWAKGSSRIWQENEQSVRKSPVAVIRRKVTQRASLWNEIENFYLKIQGRSLSKYRCFLHCTLSSPVVGLIFGMIVGFFLGWPVGCDVGLEAAVLNNVSSLPSTLIWLSNVCKSELNVTKLNKNKNGKQLNSRFSML